MIGKSYDGLTPWYATFGNEYLKTIVPISDQLGSWAHVEKREQRGQGPDYANGVYGSYGLTGTRRT